MIGKTISHYRILAKLGEGGMGAVYRAEDTKLERPVALKFLPREARAEGRTSIRFLHEAQAAAALSHPNICTVYEIDEIDGQPFIAMELIEGPDLEERIADGPLSIDEALGIACQIAAGLQEAHAHGIIHRDIKPSNIMLTGSGQAKILDFGVAKVASKSRITRTGTQPGTRIYMAPERIQGGEATPQSDQWALGAVLYEMLTGLFPFQGEIEAAVTYAILHKEALPPSLENRAVPDEIDTVVFRAMAKDPRDRFGDCHELQGAMATQISADSQQLWATPHAKPRTPARRRLLQRLGLVALTCTAVLAAAALWFFYPFLTHPDLSPHSYRTSLAVMYFRDLSEDADNRYFSDGLTEELITRLSRINDLEVKSRIDVLQYRDGVLALQELAGELGVDAIVEGSVRKFQDEVRVDVQLVDTDSGRSLWAGSYTEHLDDLFRVQDEIASRVAHALELNLSGAEERDINRAPTIAMDAYEFYLQGLAASMTWTDEGFDQGEVLLGEAIQRDPRFADAHAQLAFLNVLRTYFDLANEDSVLEVASASSERALRIDPDNEVALLSSAGATMLKVRNGLQKLNPLTGRRLVVRLKRILELNPRSLLGNLGMAHYYEWFRKDPERAKLHFTMALSTAERLADLEPENRMASGVAAQCAGRLAVFAHDDGKLEYGLELLDKSRQYTPEVSRSYFQAAFYHLELGQHQQAVDILREGSQRVTDPRFRIRLVLVLARLVIDYPDPTLDPLDLWHQARPLIFEAFEGPEVCADFVEISRDLGQTEGALSILNEVESLNPQKSIDIGLTIGALYSLDQDFDRATEEFRRQLGRSPEATDRLADVNQARVVLMLCTALEKQGRHAEADSLARHWAEATRTETWLRDALRFYAGTEDADSLREKLSPGDTYNSQMNRAAAYYYLGMHALVGGDRESARRLLAEAVDNIPDYDKYRGHVFSTEYWAARMELARM